MMPTSLAAALEARAEAASVTSMVRKGAPDLGQLRADESLAMTCLGKRQDQTAAC